MISRLYFGGTGSDYFGDVAVDNDGNIYGGGATTSPNFPVLNAAQPIDLTAGGNYAGFSLKVSGATLAYSTYVGGAAFVNTVAIDQLGDLYVVGDTTFTSFPTTTGAFQPTFGGVEDGFVQKFGPAGVFVPRGRGSGRLRRQRFPFGGVRRGPKWPPLPWVASRLRANFRS